MKNSFSLTLQSFVLTLILSVHLHAQNVHTTFSSVKMQVSQNIVLTQNLSTGIIADVFESKKASLISHNNFKKQYKNIKHVTWYLHDKVAVASFKQNDIQTRAIYSRNGRYLHTILSYNGVHLDPIIRSNIIRNFKAFLISYVTEIHAKGKVYYFVNIETSCEIKQLKVYDGEISIYNEFTKDH